MSWLEKLHPRLPSGPGGGEFASLHSFSRPRGEADYGPMRRDDLIVGSTPRASYETPHDKLSPDAHAAMQSWVNDAHREGINHDLAAGKTGDRLVASLDSAVQQGTIPIHAELWRGLAVDPGQVEDQFPIGGEVSDPRFVATATSRGLADRMLAHRTANGQAGHMLRILAPAGTHAAPGAADELVLGRHTKMRVLHRRGNVTTLEVLDTPSR